MTLRLRIARPGLFSGSQPLALAFVLVAALHPFATFARAAGIDCAKAAAPVERMICAAPSLRQADSAMADAFADALATAGDKAAVRAAQRQWLVARNACQTPACLAGQYAARQKELAGLAASARETLLAERARLRTVLGWPKDCEESYQNLIAPEGLGQVVLTTGVDTHDLGDGRTLSLVQCDMAAYQATYTAMIQDKPGGPGSLLRFPSYDREGGVTTRRMEEGLVGDVQFNDAARTLTVLTKARGVGDCGAYTVYAFPREGGPTVVEARVRECPKTPKAYIPPERWPLVKNP